MRSPGHRGKKKNPFEFGGKWFETRKKVYRINMGKYIHLLKFIEKDSSGATEKLSKIGGSHGQM